MNSQSGAMWNTLGAVTLFLATGAIGFGSGQIISLYQTAASVPTAIASRVQVPHISARASLASGAAEELVSGYEPIPSVAPMAPSSQALYNGGLTLFFCGTAVALFSVVTNWYSQKQPQYLELQSVDVNAMWSMAAEAGESQEAAVAPSEPTTVEGLKKKLLMARMMQKIKSKEFKPHEIPRDRKTIARMQTEQRFEELRAQGVDPYAKGNAKQKLWEQKQVSSQKA